MSGARQVRIIGDSHCNAIEMGLRGRFGASGGGPVHAVQMLGAATDFYKPFHRLAGGKLFLTDDKFIERARDLCRDDGALVLDQGTRILLSLGTHTQSILATALFRDHAPWYVTPDSPRGFVSDAAIEAVVNEISGPIMRFIADLKTVGADVTIVSAPPPTSRFRVFDYGYGPRDVAILDGVMRRILLGQIAEIGFPVILPPEGITDADGLLRPEFLNERLDDPHHGNARYGALMVDKILHTMPGEAAVPAH